MRGNGWTGMIGSVCAEEVVAKPSFMGCQRCERLTQAVLGKAFSGKF